MSSSKAKQLKHIFADRWRYGIRRELLFINILNMYLPSRFIALFTGIGSGYAGYVDKNYDNPLNAFDITVFDRETMEPVLFIEITGVERVSDMIKNYGLCVGAWKIYKTERFGVGDRVVYVHIITAKQSIRCITHEYLKKHARIKTIHEGLGATGKFYCVDSKYWDSLELILRKLVMVKRK